jgi:hypothetical protein
VRKELFPVIFAHIILAWVFAFSPAFSNGGVIHAEFERIVEEKGKREKATGELYYISPIQMFVRVRSPINQILYLQENLLTVYYPDDRRAFKLRSKGLFQTSFPSGLVNLGMESFLSRAGYKRKEVRGEGSEKREMWKGKLGDVEIRRRGRVLTLLDVKMKGGGRITIRYDDYVEVGDMKVPKRIYKREEVRGRKVEEVIRHSKVEFLDRIPPEVEGFRIPPGIKVEEIEM